MREIEFRGKRINYFQPKEPPKWIYGPANCTERFALMLVKEYDIWTDVERETVGQYTGLKDKNGVKIYEGDVLKFSWMRGFNLVESFKVVRFCEKTADFRFWDGSSWCPFWEGSSDIMEVVGNIFDNPEFDKQFGEVYRSKE